ncbi:trypsin-like serine protease [Xanthobacter flavus]|uniref:trypsin-like serine protease n=1 Tax=Xanthobacter flavus TaxID=281 RepID=UPI003728FA09
MNGDPLDEATRKARGLVIVNGGCSGILLNRYWVLTARHCITNEPAGATAGVDIGSPEFPANQVTITAAWDPTLSAQASDYYEFAANQNLAAGALPALDIVMVYLGLSDLGPVAGILPYVAEPDGTAPDRWTGVRLQTSDHIIQNGQGFGTFASGAFLSNGQADPRNPPQQANGLGTYRGGQFTPSDISATGYTLTLNSATQVGQGGDSGGPTLVGRRDGRGLAVAGVQSTCSATGYVPNAPLPAGASNPGWAWATGISGCQYVSVEPLVREIGDAMMRAPVCKTDAECASTTLPLILDYVLADAAPAATASLTTITRYLTSDE